MYHTINIIKITSINFELIKCAIGINLENLIYYYGNSSSLPWKGAIIIN